MGVTDHKPELDALYDRYNRREFVHPDPLEFLYLYADASDREVVGLAASVLAYGRVASILVSVQKVLDRLGPSPARRVDQASFPELAAELNGFRHRFASGEQVAALLAAAGRVRGRHGSLDACFAAHLDGADTVEPALPGFCAELIDAADRPLGHLLPLPSRGSACKRLNLFLRWMVRSDAVDPGGWRCAPPSALLVPLDVHMHRVGLELGLTARRQADLRAALEITAAFRRIEPADPVRYDFALTRLGIRRGGDLGEFLDRLRGRKVAGNG